MLPSKVKLVPPPVMHVCGACETMFSAYTFPEPEKRIAGMYVRFQLPMWCILLPRTVRLPGVGLWSTPPPADIPAQPVCEISEETTAELVPLSSIPLVPRP